MKILEVNYTDLPGRIFDGYDLHLSLNSKGYDCKQLVKSKKSNLLTVEQFHFDSWLDLLCRYEEERHSIKNLLFPYAKDIMNHPFYKDADIVHYHILHNEVISLFDYPLLFNDKKSVWTLHDPWIFTGKCRYPLTCQKWKTGCGSCTSKEPGFDMLEDNSDCMWQIKKEVLAQINPYIVVASDFMKKFVENSPMTSHWNKIVKIQFGVDIKQYNLFERNEARNSFSLSENDFVIGFREDSYIKGCAYIYEALRDNSFCSKNIVLITVGGTNLIPDDIKNKFKVIELGWVNDHDRMIKFLLSCDLFLMPSLAESFGLMAIESMAAETPVVCFKETVLEEITNAPDIGIAVEYKSSDGILKAIEEMMDNPEERERRAKAGRKWVAENYSFNEYVNKHIQLYKKIMDDKN